MDMCSTGDLANTIMWIDGRGRGLLFGVLNFGAVFDWCVWKWLVLCLLVNVLEELEGFLHVIRHV